MENNKNLPPRRQLPAEDVIDLKELFSYLIYHWIPIVVITAVCAIAAFGYSRFLITPTYQSSSVLYVLSKSTSITSIADIQRGTQLASDYTVVIKSRPVLDQVISNLDLKMTSGALSGKIRVSNPADTRLLYITVTDTSREEAKRIADEVADVSASFIAIKMDQDPPSVIQYGYADGPKVGPNTRKNTMMGAAAGFVIIAGFLVLLYILNDKIMTPEDIEKKLGLTTLGILPDENIKSKGKNKKAEGAATYAKVKRDGSKAAVLPTPKKGGQNK